MKKLRFAQLFITARWILRLVQKLCKQEKDTVMNRSITYVLMYALFTAISCTAHAQQIVIKSCNVLYDRHYQKWAKDVKKMELKDRTDLLIKAFDDPQQFLGADILCFQEWDVADADGFLHDVLVQHGYDYKKVSTYESDPADGLLIAWNAKEFVLRKDPIIHTFFDTRSNQDSQRAVGVTLESAQTGAFIHVISLHAAYIFGYEKYCESILHQLNAIKSFMQNVDAMFICGDFNYNIHSSQSLAYPNRELSEEEAQSRIFGLTEFDWHNARAEMNTTSNPTLFGYTGFELVDYILFKGNAKILSYKQYPEDPKLLIKGSKPLDGEGDDYANYFSDHAIISATFQI